MTHARIILAVLLMEGAFLACWAIGLMGAR